MGLMYGQRQERVTEADHLLSFGAPFLIAPQNLLQFRMHVDLARRSLLGHLDSVP